MDGFSVNISTIPGIQGALDRLAGDTGPLMTRIGLILAQQAADGFNSKRDPWDGAPWPALSPVTRAARRKSSSEQLEDSNRMQRAVVSGLATSTPDTAEWKPAQTIVSRGINVGQLAGIHNGNVYTQFNAPLVIVPTKRKWLTIPVTPKARQAGDVKTFKRKNPKAFYKPGNDGKSPIIAIPKRDGTLEVHWVFVKRVTIPRRRFAAMGPIQREEITKVMIAHIMGEYDR